MNDPQVPDDLVERELRAAAASDLQEAARRMASTRSTELLLGRIAADRRRRWLVVGGATCAAAAIGLAPMTDAVAIVSQLLGDPALPWSALAIAVVMVASPWWIPAVES